MKKITNLAIVLMLMASLVSFALAVEADDPPQEDPDIEDETNDEQNESAPSGEASFENATQFEIEIMNSQLGAQIRLLQLEKAILRNILKGNMTVQVLNGFDVNTTQLEAILADLQDLLSDVQAADPAANDSVDTFVQLKHEARNLTKQFRDALKDILDDQTLAMIREQLRNRTSDELQNYSMRIRHWIRQFNRNQLHRLFGFFGETNTSLLEEYLNGNITLDQAKFHLSQRVNQMSKQKRAMVFSEIKEENIKNKIQAHKAMERLGHGSSGKGLGGRP